MRNASLCESRHRILAILRRKKCTIEELSGALGISPTAVRQHLTILEADGLVSSEPIKHNMGRPKNLYSLTLKAEDYFPKKYHMLAEALIDEMAHEGDDRLRRALKNIATRIAAPYKNEVAGKSITERMIVLQRVLEENGGDVVVRKEKSELNLFNYNCPLKALSSKYPDLCDIHYNLIRSITGTEVEREKCMARNDEYCQFKIG